MERVVLVGPAAWQPLADAAFAPLDARRQRFARVLLRFFHDRHLGITPRLAADLAQLLRPDSSSSPAAGAWAPALGRMTAELPGGALVPGAAAFYWLSRVAVPLLARACETVGVTHLFSAAEWPLPAGFAKLYTAYARDLLAEVAGTHHFSEAFWTDRALTLHQLSRSGGEGLAEVDETALAQLLRLKPDVPDLPRPPARRLRPSPSYRPRRHRNEGGVDGIHRSRRLADLPGILKSEFVHPKEIRLERLLESGFFALRRPVREEKLRDVLIAAVLPPPSGGAVASHALVKAGWLDALLRITAWLQQGGWTRSEFRWLEGDRFGRLRAHVRSLEELSHEAATRRERLDALGFVPDFFDRHAEGVWPAAEPLPELDWAAAAWRSLREEAFATKGYAAVSVMLFLSRGLAGRPRTSLASLRRALRLPQERGYRLAVTWVPEALDDLSAESGWAVTTPANALRPLFLHDRQAAGPEDDLENRIATALETVWLRSIVQGVLRD